MKISVAMTTYNGEKFIVKQLETLRKQSRQVDEVIICDDRSTDRTCFLIREYIKKHKLDTWNFTRNTKNLGFIENFRHAISMTSGDIIFLADQDDEWELHKIEKMSEIMLTHSEINALMTSVCFIDQNSEFFIPSSKQNWYLRMQKMSENKLMEVDFIEICKENFAPGCTMCFRKEIANKYIQMENERKIYHDWLIGLLAAREKGLYMLFTPLIRYRLHSNNAIGMTQKKKKKVSSDEIKRLYDQKERIKLGLNSDYCNQEAIGHDIHYIDARIRLYREKNLHNLVRVLCSSFNAKNIVRSCFKANCKDILFFLGFLYR